MIQHRIGNKEPVITQNQISTNAFQKSILKSSASKILFSYLLHWKTQQLLRKYSTSISLQFTSTTTNTYTKLPKVSITCLIHPTLNSVTKVAAGLLKSLQCKHYTVFTKNITYKTLCSTTVLILIIIIFLIIRETRNGQLWKKQQWIRFIGTLPWIGHAAAGNMICINTCHVFPSSLTCMLTVMQMFPNSMDRNVCFWCQGKN